MTLTAMETLVGVRVRQGRDAEAEAMYLEIIDGCKEVLGTRSMQTLGAMTNFGQFLRQRERYEEALELLETSLPIKREALGNDHLFTRIAMRELAATYEALDRRAEAAPLRGELLDYRVRTVDHTNAGALNAAAWELLKHKYQELHDPQRASGLAERACELERSEGGENLWAYLDTLALAQHMDGDTATAVETQRRAIALMPPSEDDPEMHDRLAEYEAALANRDAGVASGGTP